MTRTRRYPEASDSELMAWSAGGDVHAFDEVVARHGAFALRVAARLLGDAALAEDVVQNAMVRAWREAGRFDPARAKLTTWLYRIVVNLCIDQGRRARWEPWPENFDPVDPAAAPDVLLAAADRDAALARAVADLPMRHRTALTLVYDEGLSGADAARAMGTSAKAVERLLARAVATLRRHLSSWSDR